MSLIEKAFKEQPLNEAEIQQKYQAFKFLEEDFDQIVAAVKKVMIKSQLFKMPLLKDAIMKISSLRECIVYDEELEGKEEQTLFGKLGGIDGLSKIMDKVFKSILDD